MKQPDWNARLTRLSIRIGRRMKLDRPASWTTVAAQLGVSVQSVNNWRAGRSAPSERLAQKIVEAESL